MALRLQPWRKNQLLAERCYVFVGGEARSIGRELEQHSAWLEEIHRLEPEPIDDFSWTSPRAIDSVAHFQLRRVIGYTPRDVVNAARSPPPALGVGNFANLQIASGSSTAEGKAGPFAIAGHCLEAKRLSEKRRDGREIALPKTHGMQAEDLLVRWHWTLEPRSELARIGSFDQREGQAVRIGNRKCVAAAPCLPRFGSHSQLGKPSRPVIDGTDRDRERHLHAQAMTGSYRR